MNIDGNALGQYGQGAVIAIVSILMVFVVLLLIIFLTDLVTKFAGKEEVKEVVEKTDTSNTILPASKLNLDDEDAVIASLIASIDMRRETGKHIQVLSVREVK